MKHRLCHAAIFVAMLALSPQPATATEPADGFSIGITGGYNKWKLRAGPFKGSEGATSVGVVARYTVPVSDSMFTGAHIGIQRDGTSESIWSADLLFRFGRNMEAVLPYIALGPSIMRGEALFEDHVHLGLKAAVGGDIPITDHMALLVQTEYARYAPEEYGPLKIRGNIFGARMGLLYTF